jgi:hypothetical protein
MTNAFRILLACLIGFGLVQPASAQSPPQSQTDPALQKDIDAYHQRCDGVTLSQYALYKQCADEQTELNTRLPGTRGGHHGGSDDDD